MWTDSIDKIFVVNTTDDAGRQRLYGAIMEAYKYNMEEVQRYAAILDTENGANGLLQTMHKLFKECQGMTLLVLEDDFKFIRAEVNDVPEVMEKVMEQLPDNWDMLYLGCNLLTPPEKVSDNVLRVRAAYSSHSVLYSQKGIELILNLWDEEKPYDNFLMQKIQPYGNSYCTMPMLCSQRKGISSIFKYEPAKQIGIEKYYDTGTGEIDWGKMMEERFKEFTGNLS